MAAKDMSGETESAPDPKQSGVTRLPGVSVREGQLLLGRYRVERVLGQGGMGTVVAARHLELDRLFAFKFLHGEAVSRPEVIERFVREARSAARLENEHIAKVHDVGRLESGEPYMLMEHLTGRDLDRVLEEDGPLQLEAVLRHVLQACEAVAEAHARGIIHRDLKPSNLFLHVLRSGRETLKVLDFGISKELTAEGAKLTSTHAMIGSPLYMSPEQVLQPKLVDARSDVWALGVVLYELSTGQPPFLGDGVPEVIGKILQEKPLPPSRVRPGLPDWFDAIVMRCLEKAVHERFQSVSDLADGLSRRERAALAAGGDPHATVERTAAPPPRLALCLAETRAVGTPSTPPTAPAQTPSEDTPPPPERASSSTSSPMSASAPPSSPPARRLWAGAAAIGLAVGIAALLSSNAPQAPLTPPTADADRAPGASPSPAIPAGAPSVELRAAGEPAAIGPPVAPSFATPSPSTAPAARHTFPTPRSSSVRPPSTAPVPTRHDPLDTID